MTLPEELELGGTPAIRELAGRYSPYYQHTDKFIRRMLRNAYERESRHGHITRDELLMVNEWKNGGRHRLEILRNEPNWVIDRSRKAFETREIVPLTKDLLGVGIANASAIMHFVFDKEYPIIDSYALQTLGVDEGRSKDLDRYWKEYRRLCCAWSGKYELGLRTLDRALWQYHRERLDRERRGVYQVLDPVAQDLEDEP